MDLAELYSLFASIWVVWLFVLFAGIVVWVYRPKRRRELQDRAMIPLRDDER